MLTGLKGLHSTPNVQQQKFRETLGSGWDAGDNKKQLLQSQIPTQPTVASPGVCPGYLSS